MRADRIANERGWMKRTRLRRMSQQRKLRKSGQGNVATGASRKAFPDQKEAVLRAIKCCPETSRGPKSP